MATYNDYMAVIAELDAKGAIAGLSYVTDMSVDSENCAYDDTHPLYWESMIECAKEAALFRFEDADIDFSTIKLSHELDAEPAEDLDTALHMFINVDALPHGALFISITPKTKAVYAYFGETWVISDYVYCDSDVTPVNLGESLMPVDEPTVIALPLTLTDITDVAPLAWANYVTVSDSGIVRFWEHKPSKASNSDDFESCYYDFEIMTTNAGLTKLPYFYAVCYSLKGDLNG